MKRDVSEGHATISHSCQHMHPKTRNSNAHQTTVISALSRQKKGLIAWRFSSDAGTTRSLNIKFLEMTVHTTDLHIHTIEEVANVKTIVGDESSPYVVSAGHCTKLASFRRENQFGNFSDASVRNVRKFIEDGSQYLLPLGHRRYSA